MSQTWDRSRVMDFTSTIESDYPLVIRFRKEIVQSYSILSVYSMDMWQSCGLFVLLLLGYTWLLSRFCAPSILNGSWNAIFHLIGALLCQGCDCRIRRASLRIIHLNALVFGLFVFTTFGALMTSLFSVKSYLEPMNDLSQILSAGVDVYLLQGTNHEEGFKSSIVGSPAYTLWHSKLTESPEFLQPDTESLYKTFLESENSVMVINPKTFAYMVSQDPSKGCQLVQESAKFSKAQNSLGFPKGSPFLRLFDFHVKRIKESGLVDLWKQDWLTRLDQSHSYLCHSFENQLPKSVDAKEFSLIFKVIGVGCLSGLVCLIFEYCSKPKRPFTSDRNPDMNILKSCPFFLITCFNIIIPF